MSNSDNKLIMKNTIIIYIRMIVVTIVGLFSSRYVLQALGASDYGLYNVVAGLIAMLNFISTAMSTTTRRFVNIEMGKPDGDINKIFNVSLLLHIGFALVILLVAETIGIWYINNMLNVAPGKESDAMFVFQISTIVACIGIVNVPYQSLIEAYEKFTQAAIIDIATALIKFLLVIVLVFYPYNALRFYAICICVVTFASFILYHYVCYKHWPMDIKHKLYRKCPLYREILVFNTYTALGAIASIGKSQGGNLLINFFFGTVVNAAFAVAYQVDSYVYMFVNKLTLASNPQIAKNYSGGDANRSYLLVEKNTKYSILIMTVFYFSIIPNIDFILELWLKKGMVPAGATLLCCLTLTDALVRSFSEGTNGLIQASGKIKWFQITNSVILLSVLPISYLLFKLGFAVYWIVVGSVVASLSYRIVSLVLMKRLMDFNVLDFVKRVYIKPFYIIVIMGILSLVYRNYSIESNLVRLLSIIIFGFITCELVYLIGLEPTEKESINKGIIRIKHKIWKYQNTPQ